MAYGGGKIRLHISVTSSLDTAEYIVTFMFVGLTYPLDRWLDGSLCQPGCRREKRIFPVKFSYILKYAEFFFQNKYSGII
jgi:hypothetical protein